MKTVRIAAGVVGHDVGSKRRVSPQYRFNTTVTAQVVEVETRGCGEFERRCVIVNVEGKRLSITESKVEYVA